MPTPPPLDPIADSTPPGDPNDAPLAVVGAPFHPASISPDLNEPVQHPSTSTALVAHLESHAPTVADDDPLPLSWAGEPSRAALRRLRREAWTPTFDAEMAFAVFQAVSEGRTVRQVCAMPGMPRRWEIVAWRAMVPAFEELMAAAETALGAEMRDRAVEAMTPPADSRDPPDDRSCAAFLKLAASFDRRIARGDEGAGSGSITVNLASFAAPSDGR